MPSRTPTAPADTEPTDTAAYIARIAADYPPLTDERKRRLAVLFRPGVIAARTTRTTTGRRR